MVKREDIKMDREVDKLKKEVLILRERVSILEGKEHRRSVMRSVKTLINIGVILLFAFGIWKAYDYVNNYLPNYLEEKVLELNPFGDID